MVHSLALPDLACITRSSRTVAPAKTDTAEVQVQILDYKRFHEGVVPGPVWLTGQDKIVIFTIQSVWTCTSMLVAYESCDPDIQVL